jgi:putative AlgH/UPF0301 family transcriptional regulator
MMLTTIAPFLFSISIFIVVSVLACYCFGVRPDFIVVNSTQTQLGLRMAFTRRGAPVAGLQAGLVIRASPRIAAGPFRNSRVLIASYSVASGSLGYLLNQRVFHNGTWRIIGGPVDINSVSVLHNTPAPNSIVITQGLYLGGDYAHGEGFRHISIHGYAGWHPYQLDGEIRAGDWEIEGQVDPAEVLAV